MNKTLLIILGVIIALLMTIGSPLFTAEVAWPEAPEEKVENEVTKVEPIENFSSSSSPKYHSAARLFHLFTENLPYLNNK